MKILLVEDDQRMAELIKDCLSCHSLILDIVNSGELIIDKLNQENYDLLILDILLPKKNGIDICREIRKANITINILFITALQTQKDKIKAFESGADDYLIKPFDFQELSLRVKALLRRKEGEIKVQFLQWERLKMIPSTQEVTYNQEKLHLTPIEFDILEVFLNNPQQIFNVDTLIERIWDTQTIPTRSTLRTHIKTLRKKLNLIGADHNFIQTVHGVGYRLQNQEKLNQLTNINQSSTQSQQDNSLENNKSKAKTKEEKDRHLRMFIKEIWEDNKDNIKDDLDQVINYLQKNNPQINHETAVFKIHNLVGFLGSIGFSEVTPICRNIEDNLKINDVTEKLNIVQETIDKIEKVKNILFEENIVIDNCDNKKSAQKLFSILFVEEDKNLIHSISEEIKKRKVNYTLDFVNHPKDLEIKTQNKKYDLAILGTVTTHHQIREDIMQFLESLALPIPPIIYTKDDSINTRLYYTKKNISAFFSQQTSPQDLLIYLEKEIEKPVFVNQQENFYNILIIDDDKKFIHTLEKKLQNADLPLNIYNSSNALQFLKTIERIKPDLIILDLQMPKLNGLDICHILKQDNNLKKIFVVFLTGYLDDEIISKFVEVGADDFVSKSKIDVELYPRMMNLLRQLEKPF